MSKGKKFAIAIAVLAFTALVSGLTTLAVTNYGSQSDPLVTLSYLNETVKPEIQAAVEQAMEAKAAELTEQFRQIAGQSTGASGDPQPSGFVVVTLKKGQAVTCGVGTEIMLRIGTAVSNGPDSPRLIDETGGVSVSDAGAELTVNHMYMVTIKGNGVKATRDNTKLLLHARHQEDSHSSP